MFKIPRRKMILRLISFCTITILSVVAIKIVAARNTIEDTSAASSTASVSHVDLDGNGDTNDGGDKINYGHDGDGWTTRIYQVTRDGVLTRAFCAQPRLADPTWPIDNTVSVRIYEGSNANPMKLIMYMLLNNELTSEINSHLSNLGATDYNHKYAYIHAVLGDLYGGDTYGLSQADIDIIRSIESVLRNYINNNNDIWLKAKNYVIYEGINQYSPEHQNVVWIENGYIYGSIKVQKQDLSTNNTPQGNASLAGITFKVYNDSGNRIYNQKNNTFYNNGAEVASGVTAADGTITFSNLLSGGVKYLVKETATNASYELTSTTGQPATLTTSGQVVTLNFKDNVRKGEITVNKTDSETESCTNKTENFNFTGTRIQIINDSTNPILYNGDRYAKGDIIETKTFGENDCSLTFENLPYGSYQIKEVAASTGYALNSVSIPATVPNDGGAYNISVNIKNQPIRGDLTFVKKDSNNDKVMPNTLFSITALDSAGDNMEVHYVVTDENGVIDTRSSFAPHSYHTNGYDEIYDDSYNVSFAGYGVWFGRDSNGAALPVKDDVGALPYGNYIIEELRCDANRFCYNIKDQKKRITINKANQLIDLGDWDNACAEFSLETEATDASDSDHIVEADKNARIKDTISYCVKKDTDFVIKGILMDKETGEPLQIDGKNIESSINLNSKEECGTTEMYFEINAEELGGKEVVVYEKLYYHDELVASHEDIDDEAQTVYILKMKTFASDADTGEKVVPISENVKIKDEVQYCLFPDVEYTIKAVLMDKTTKNGVLINSEPVEQTITFTPKERCGSIDMYYNIDTSNLAGVKLVFFESLYVEDELLIEHRDFEDEGESFEVELPAPDTGANTKNHDGGIAGGTPVFIGAAVVLCLGGYVTSRLSARKRFYK